MIFIGSVKGSVDGGVGGADYTADIDYSSIDWQPGDMAIVWFGKRGGGAIPDTTTGYEQHFSIGMTGDVHGVRRAALYSHLMSGSDADNKVFNVGTTAISGSRLFYIFSIWRGMPEYFEGGAVVDTLATALPAGTSAITSTPAITATLLDTLVLSLVFDRVDPGTPTVVPPTDFELTDYNDVAGFIGMAHRYLYEGGAVTPTGWDFDDVPDSINAGGATCTVAFQAGVDEIGARTVQYPVGG